MGNYNDRKKMVKDCKRYIETHLYDKLSVQLLAKIAHASDATLRRSFDEIGGYSVHQYIRLRRIHMAARYLRHGGDVENAFRGSGFSSKSGFAEAFTDIYGITPWEFAKSRGMELMQEPKIMRRPDFHIVGYMFLGVTPTSWEDSGAYYIIQDFPEVSAREWARIGGRFDMIGTWMELDGESYYIFGPGVKEVRYIPKPLGTLYVPGGEFAVFPVEKPKNPEDSTVLCENVQVTWYYALSQWLPDSDYELDESRIPYEFYLDGNNLVCVPIVPKIKPKEKPQKRNRTRSNRSKATTE